MASKEVTEASQVKQSSQQTTSTASSSPCPSQLDQMVVPTVPTLQGSQHIKAELDQRLRQLVDLNKQASQNHRGVEMKLFVLSFKYHGLRTLF